MPVLISEDKWNIFNLKSFEKFFTFYFLYKKSFFRSIQFVNKKDYKHDLIKML